MDGACSTHEIRKAYKILARKPKGKRPLWRPRYGCDNIKMDVIETGCEDVD
jgi:phage baseplate assembly protein W